MALTLLTWPDYISPLTLSQFQDEFKVQIDLEMVPSAVELVEKMRAGGTQSPDLLVPPDYAVRELVAEGRLLPLVPGRLPNLKNIAPRFRNGRPHDPESKFSVIKDWGTTGFMYRTDCIDERPASWTDFWRLAKTVSGHVTVLDSPGEVIGAALKMRGHSYNASDPAALEQAAMDLQDLKPHLLTFETNYRPLLESGQAVLSLGWNGDAAALQAQGIPVRYVIPMEGSQIWEDDWCIAADAPNPELAHLFLDFVLRPEVAAQEARYTRYATGNQAGLALLEQGLRDDPSTYPSDEILSRLEAGMPVDQEGARRREDLWQAIRNPTE